MKGCNFRRVPLVVGEVEMVGECLLLSGESAKIGKMYWCWLWVIHIKLLVQGQLSVVNRRPTSVRSITISPSLSPICVYQFGFGVNQTHLIQRIHLHSTIILSSSFYILFNKANYCSSPPPGGAPLCTTPTQPGPASQPASLLSRHCRASTPKWWRGDERRYTSLGERKNRLIGFGTCKAIS